ncbi:MAG: hypothetical protein M3340_11205 [Actinomycetota bacterium]|nr:hypothetical protein [Actinomycetota bacterium]
MTENPQQGPDEVPTDEQLDVEGPNESAQPSGAPGLEGGEAEPDDAAEAEGEQ